MESSNLRLNDNQKQRSRWDLAWIGLLCLVHTVFNLVWRQTNVTVLGWDRMAHLVRSLEYFDAMHPFNTRDLFNALMQDSFYPPLFHISMAVVYTFFGVSADVGAMTNTIYLVILLFSVYGIGCELYDSKTGLLAACLISFFPIVFLMERFTYTEFSLLALVALNVWVALKTERFTQRGWTYALGVTLGLGFLAKWVFIVFAGPPLLYIFLTSPICHELKDITNWRQLDRKKLLLSVAVGTVGAGIFYLFGGDWTLTTPFDSIIALCYWVLLTCLTYIIVSPSRPLNNFLATLIITLIVAIIWYVPNLDFISTALYKAFYWGSTERTGEGFPVGILIRGIVNEDLSAPLAAATISLCLWWLVRIRKRLWAVSASVHILAIWFCVPFLFFASFSNPSSWNMRLSIGLVLPLALILARASLTVPRVRVRAALIIGLITIAVSQWLVLSFDVFAPLPDRTRLTIPVWGEVNWFAQGEFVQWPSSKLTSRDYWILPSVFRTVRLDSEHSGRQAQRTLGVLANAPYINHYQARFLSETEYPDIEVVNLMADRDGLPVYSQIFQLDYLVVNDGAAGGPDATDQSIILATAILHDTPEEFSKAFREIASFQLPNRDTVHLYRNSSYELPRFVPPKFVPRSIRNITNITFGDQLSLIGYTVTEPIEGESILLELYWLSLRSMEEDYSIILKLLNPVYQVWGQQEGRPCWGSYPTLRWAKGEVVKDIREIPILPGTPPGEYMIELSLYGMRHEIWLSPDQQDDVLLGPVKIPQREIAPERLDIQYQTEAVFGSSIRLLGYNIESDFRSGGNIHLTLFWQALQSVDVSYTVFCHLVGPQGQMWGQKDNPPAAGFYPTDVWTAGQIIRDQYDIPISLEAQPGSCSLDVGLFIPEAGARLPVIGSDGRVSDDHFTISGLTIVQ